MTDNPQNPQNPNRPADMQAGYQQAIRIARPKRKLSYTPKVKLNLPTFSPYNRPPTGEAPVGQWTGQSYWQDPQRIARAALISRAMPPGYIKPEWLDPDTEARINASYNYLSQTYGNEWWNWGHKLPDDDPLKAEAAAWRVPNELIDAEAQTKPTAPQIMALYGITDDDLVRSNATQDDLVNSFMGIQSQLNYTPAEVTAPYDVDEAWLQTVRATPEDVKSLDITGLQPIYDKYFPDYVRNTKSADAMRRYAIRFGAANGIDPKVAATLPLWQFPMIALFRTTGGQAAQQALNFGIMGYSLGGTAGALLAGGAMGGLTLLMSKEEEKKQAALAAGQEYDANKVLRVADAAFWVLNQAFEGLETTFGMQYQIQQALVDMVKGRGTGELEDIFNNLPAAVEASRIYWDTALPQAQVLENMVQGEGAYFEQWELGKPEPKKIEVDPQIGVTLGAMRDIRKSLAAGYSMREIMAMWGDRLKSATMMTENNPVFAAKRAEMGFVGELGELAAGYLFDPLDISGRIVNLAGANIADIKGNKVLSFAYRMTDGPLDAVKMYGALLRTGALPGSPTAKQIGGMGAFTRMLAGVDENGNPAKGATSPIGKVFGLTRESLAYETMTQSASALQMAINEVESVPEIVKLISGLARYTPELAAEISGRMPWVDSPDGASFAVSLREYKDTLTSVVATWEAGTENRVTWEQISKALKKDNVALLEDARKNGAASIIAALEKAVASNPKANQALIQKMQAGILTADTLTGMLDAHKNGAFDLNLNEFKGRAFVSMFDTIEKWAVEYYGIKPDSPLTRFFQSIKEAQSFALLGFNPIYFLNNLLSNRVTMAWQGVFGLRSRADINLFWENIIGFTPIRVDAGIGGVAGLGTDIDIERLKFNVGGQIRNAKRVEGGLLTAFSDFMSSDVMSKVQVATRLSQHEERAASRQAFTAGAMKALPKFWQVGVGFDRMPGTLVNGLRKIDPKLPEMFYSLIAGNPNPKNLYKALFEDINKRNIDAVVFDAVESMRAAGITIDDEKVRTTLNDVGVLDFLTNGLLEAQTREEIINVNDTALEMIQTKLDDMARKAIGDEAAAASAKAVTEGVAGALEYFDRMWHDQAQFWSDHFEDWQTVNEEAAALDKTAKNARYNAQRAASRREWARMQSVRDAAILGTIRGLDAGDAVTNDIGIRLEYINAVWGEFYNTTDRLHRDFWSRDFPDKESRSAAWKQLEDDLARMYVESLAKEETHQKEIDSQFADIFARQTRSDPAIAQAWRDNARDIRTKMGKRMSEFRKSLSEMSGAERRAAWTKFIDEEYNPTIQKLTAANMARALEMYRASGPVKGEPAIVRPKILDIRVKLVEAGIGTEGNWIAILPELNSLLESEEARFTREDYSTTPSQEKLDLLDKVLARREKMKAEAVPEPEPPAPTGRKLKREGVPAFMTSKIKSALKEDGYTAQQIANMTPNEAIELIVVKDEQNGRDRLGLGYEDGKPVEPAPAPKAEEPAPYDGTTERRQDVNKALRAAWDSMEADDQFKTAFLDEKTGIYVGNALKVVLKNKIGAAELPYLVYLDGQGLGWWNEGGGDMRVKDVAGDKMIAAIARAIMGETLESYRLHSDGDEYVMRFPSQEAAEAAIARARETLQKTPIEIEYIDGRKEMVVGADFFYGIGKANYETTELNDLVADARLNYTSKKEAAKQAGEYADKGKKPIGITPLVGKESGLSVPLQEAVIHIEQMKRIMYYRAKAAETIEVTDASSVRLMAIDDLVYAYKKAGREEKAARAEIAEAVALVDARAAVWAHENGRTAADWWTENIAGVMTSEQFINEYGPDMGIQAKGAQAAVVPVGKRNLIAILTDPDAATLPHELAHIFRRELGIADIDTLLTEFDRLYGYKLGYDASTGKFTGDAKIVEAAEEAWANGFELLLREGKAPSPGLQGVFDKFKVWLKAIYKSLKTGQMKDVKLSDPMRDIYNRLLAEPPAPEAEAAYGTDAYYRSAPVGNYVSYTKNGATFYYGRQPHPRKLHLYPEWMTDTIVHGVNILSDTMGQFRNLTYDTIEGGATATIHDRESHGKWYGDLRDTMKAQGRNLDEDMVVAILNRLRGRMDDGRVMRNDQGHVIPGDPGTSDLVWYIFNLAIDVSNESEPNPRFSYAFEDKEQAFRDYQRITEQYPEYTNEQIWGEYEEVAISEYIDWLDEQAKKSAELDAMPGAIPAQVAPERFAQIAEVANRFGIPSAKADGTPETGFRVHIANIMARYMPEKYAQGVTFESIDPADLEIAMTRRAAAKEQPTPEPQAEPAPSTAIYESALPAESIQNYARMLARQGDAAIQAAIADEPEQNRAALQAAIDAEKAAGQGAEVQPETAAVQWSEYYAEYPTAIDWINGKIPEKLQRYADAIANYDPKLSTARAMSIAAEIIARKYRKETATFDKYYSKTDVDPFGEFVDTVRNKENETQGIYEELVDLSGTRFAEDDATLDAYEKIVNIPNAEAQPAPIEAGTAAGTEAKAETEQIGDFIYFRRNGDLFRAPVGSQTDSNGIPTEGRFVEKEFFADGKLNILRAIATGDPLANDPRIQAAMNWGTSFEDAKRALVEIEKATKTWQIPLAEFIKDAGKNAPTKTTAIKAKEFMRSSHKMAVRQALIDGLPVPDEVLADYPELAAEYKQTPPAATAARLDAGEEVALEDAIKVTPEIEEEVRSKTAPVFGRPQGPKQTNMFTNGEDLPIFSGTAQRAKEEVFNPAQTDTGQDALFNTREYLPTIEGREVQGPGTGEATPLLEGMEEAQTPVEAAATTKGYIEQDSAVLESASYSVISSALGGRQNLVEWKMQDGGIVRARWIISYKDGLANKRLKVLTEHPNGSYRIFEETGYGTGEMKVIDSGKIRPELPSIDDLKNGEVLFKRRDIWDIGSIEQEYKSERTSINSSKLPATFNRIDVKQGDVIADIGGGRFDNAERWAAERGATLHVIDPFNRTRAQNARAIAAVRNGRADIVTVNNTLNVIRETDNRRRVIEQAANALKPGGTAYFLIYEGNQSGIGAASQQGASWQNNTRAAAYLNEIKSVFGSATIKNGMIQAKKTNAGILFKRADPTNTPEFKRWFGESKVVDDEGQPLVVYHGTLNSFNEFDPSKIGSATDPGEYGEGFYFGLDPEDIASSYLHDEKHWNRPAKGANIMPVYLRLNNPINIRNRAELLEKMGVSLDGKFTIEGLRETAKTIPEWLESNGYDGIIVQTRTDEGKRLEIREIIALHPEQIKSTFNQGTFDPNNPNILFKRAGTSKHISVRKVKDGQTFGGFNIRAGVYYTDVQGASRLVAFLPERYSIGQWQKNDQGDYRILGLDPDNENNWVIENRAGKLDKIPRAKDNPVAVNAPIGTADASNAQPPIYKGMQEYYNKDVKPIMQAIREASLKTETGVRVPGMERINDGTPEMRELMRELKAYTAKVQGQSGGVRLAAAKVGEIQRDMALLNYTKRYGFDNFLTAIMPYQFWYTRSVANWAARFIDKPSIIANYGRLRAMQERHTREGFPTRLNGKVGIPLPFLPEGAGDAIYIDPQRIAFPFENFATPFSRLIQQDNRNEKAAKSIIYQWMEDGTTSEADGTAAMKDKKGDLWERALEEAVTANDQDIANPLDFMNVMSGFSLPINIIYQNLRGTPKKLSPLPFTRLIQAAGGLAGVDPELIQKASKITSLGLPANDNWQDYRIDRELANMTADGMITADEAKRAMIDRTGDVFEAARRRLGKQQGIKYLFASFMSDLYPEGEQTQRALTNEYYRAIDVLENGDTQALTKFYDAHPEYEARVAQMQDPEERLRRFLIAEVWGRYKEQNPAEKRAYTKEFGETFELAFLDSNTRDYSAIDTNTLAWWANNLGANMPKSAPDTPGVVTPDMPPTVQQYYDEMESQFPNNGRIWDMYYKMDAAGQAQLRAAYPQLDAYTAWKNKYLATHPEVIQYVTNDNAELAGLPMDIQSRVYTYRALRDERYPGIFEIQDGYYAIPEDQRKAYKKEYPELEEYWDWRRTYAAAYPKASPWILSEESLSNAITGQYGDAEQLTNEQLAEFSPALMRALLAAKYGGDELRSGMESELYKHWQDFGEPGDDYDAWVRDYVYKSLE